MILHQVIRPYIDVDDPLVIVVFLFGLPPQLLQSIFESPATPVSGAIHLRALLISSLKNALIYEEK
jgi:hypothetical protein